MTLHYPVYVQPVVGDANFPNGIPFTAQELRRNIQAALAVASPVTQSGVTPLDGQFAVTQHAAGANFSVDVAAGHAFVAGTDIAGQAVYGCWNDGVVNVVTPNPPVSGTENHRLVLQIEDKFSNGVWTGYTANLNLLADTGSGTPPQPASSITLALISIAAGQASVLNANITDQRPMIGAVLAAYKAAATTYNSATMTADPDLHFTMAPGAVYRLDATLQYQATTAADPGIAAEFTFPAGTKMTLAIISAMAHGQTPNLGSIDELTGAFEMHTLLQSTRISAIFSGTVVTSATAGTFALNFAENTSGDPVEVLQLSSMTAQRIA